MVFQEPPEASVEDLPFINAYSAQAQGLKVRSNCFRRRRLSECPRMDVLGDW